MLRETIIVIFTVALVGLTSFTTEAIRGLVAGNVEAVMSGFIASLAGIVVCLLIVFGAGWWLIRDDRRTKARDEQRYAELINRLDVIIHNKNPEGIENGESKPTKPGE
jgi:uncharacterized membrane protein YdjX (TVP38/TMEM64 family)